VVDGPARSGTSGREKSNSEHSLDSSPTTAWRLRPFNSTSRRC